MSSTTHTVGIATEHGGVKGGPHHELFYPHPVTCGELIRSDPVLYFTLLYLTLLYCRGETKQRFVYLTRKVVTRCQGALVNRCGVSPSAVETAVRLFCRFQPRSFDFGLLFGFCGPLYVDVPNLILFNLSQTRQEGIYLGLERLARHLASFLCSAGLLEAGGCVEVLGWAPAWLASSCRASCRSGSSDLPSRRPAAPSALTLLAAMAAAVACSVGRTTLRCRKSAKRSWS